MNDTNYKTSSYRGDIDGLRAVAVVAVIISHISEDALPSGYLGVDIFFVISGFVITGSLLRAKSNSFGELAALFYEKRIKRLLPALAFFVITLAIIVTLIDIDAGATLDTGYFALFGLSNIQLMLESTDYFGQIAKTNAFTHTWSLGVEEQFYLIFPLLFWFAFRRVKGDLAYRILGWLIFFISIISLTVFYSFYESHQPRVYFLMPTRFWEFGAGVLMCLIGSRTAGEIGLMRRISPTLVLAILVLWFFAPTEYSPENTLFVVILTCLLIGTMQEKSISHVILTSRLFQYVGLISYSLYLWHWGVLSVARMVFGGDLSYIMLLIALMFILASFSYFIIERPLRYANWSPSSLRTIMRGVSGVIICAAFIFTLKSAYPRLQDQLIVAFDYDVTHIHKTWWTDHRTREYLEVCHVRKFYSPELLNRCVPIINDNPRIFLIGDSHARNYLPTLRTIFPTYDVSYLTMGYGCAYLPSDLSQRYDRDVECTQYVREVTDRLISAIKPGDLTVIGQRLRNNPERWTSHYFDFLDLNAQQFIKKGAQVILLDGPFPMEIDPQFCLTMYWRTMQEDCILNEEQVINAYPDFDRLAYTLADKREDFFYAFLRTGLCRNGYCQPVSPNGNPVWHDDDGHITEAAAIELAPTLAKKLAEQEFTIAD